MLSVQTIGHSYFEKNMHSNKKIEMNGIPFEKYKDFPSKWKLVTVRYRLDSKEIRLIYANEKAWSGLNLLTPKYVDGAIFGKISFIAESDPSFTSSLTPSGVKRYQLMVKDSKRFSETEGWGYALFNGEGGLFNEDLKIKTMACAACHRIVPERDYVFSRKAHFNIGSQIFANSKSDHSDKSSLVQFVFTNNAKVPNSIKNEMIDRKQDVSFVDGPLKKNAFSGTLDEIIPFLIENSKTTGKGSALYISDTHFSFVEKTKDDCVNKTENKFHVVIKFNNGLVRNNEICQ